MLSFLKPSISQRSSGLPAIGSMTFGRSAVIASRPLPRLAASTTAEREALEADRYSRSAAEYSSASCRRKISSTDTMRSSMFTSVWLS